MLGAILRQSEAAGQTHADRRFWLEGDSIAARLHFI
jgi:hypothetical protein